MYKKNTRNLIIRKNCRISLYIQIYSLQLRTSQSQKVCLLGKNYQYNNNLSLNYLVNDKTFFSAFIEWIIIFQTADLFTFPPAY